MRNPNGMTINDGALAGNETLHQLYDPTFLELASCQLMFSARYIYMYMYIFVYHRMENTTKNRTIQFSIN